jgi:hypothetical protein
MEQAAEDHVVAYLRAWMRRRWVMRHVVAELCEAYLFTNGKIRISGKAVSSVTKMTSDDANFLMA